MISDNGMATVAREIEFVHIHHLRHQMNTRCRHVYITAKNQFLFKDARAHINHVWRTFSKFDRLFSDRIIILLYALRLDTCLREEGTFWVPLINHHGYLGKMQSVPDMHPMVSDISRLAWYTSTTEGCSTVATMVWYGMCFFFLVLLHRKWPISRFQQHASKSQSKYKCTCHYRSMRYQMIAVYCA